jgi:large conductance mechanosensitive channel
MLKEFKEFAMKGSLLDMAVGVVMAGAFGKVTSAFIDGMFMPLVAQIFQADFSEWKSVLSPAVVGADGKETAAEIAVKYGDFVASVVNFIIVALVMFMIIRAMNASKKSEPAPPPPPPPVADTLLGEIRDLLKSGR